MAKTRAEPSSNPSNDTKRKKSSKRMKTLLSARSAPLKPAENPFATIWSRRKFDVLGKKRKGEERRIGLSRSLAIEKRKKTLQKEYEQSSKSTVFNDKRFGEHDESLPDYAKAILRLQKERLSKLKRKNKYNISDDEEETEKDDFEETLPPDEDENEDFLNLDTKNRSTDFNQTEGSEQPYKTKKQVMSEVIEKSKFFKAEKAKEKEEDEQLMEKLDQEFNSLAQTEALNALLTKNKTGQTSNGKSTGSKPDFSLIKEKPDAYDKLVKEMVMESRARPSDRVKTPEETAREERERLEQLEEERQKRMFAPDDDDSSEEEDYNDDDNKKISKKLQNTSGDDLGDSFQLDNDPINKNEEDSEEDESEEDEEDSEEDESEEDEKEELVKDWEQSDDEEPILDPNEQADDLLIIEKKEKKNKENELKIKNGLPFVIEAPNNLKELCDLLDNRSESEIIEAIKRIRACNSIKLGTDNRKKMQVFYGLLLQYFATVSSRSPLKPNILDALVKPLIEMSSEIPYFAAICARERLIKIRTKFCQDLKTPGKDSWPNVKSLALFRLWSLKFPSSDFRHVVTTPLLLMICEFLMRCPVLSGRHLAVGSFLCSLLLSAVKQSKKYCSEAITFIQTLLLSSLNLDHEIQIPSQLSELVEQREIKPYLYVKNKECELKRINFITFFESQLDSPYFSSDEFKTSVLLSASEALMGFIQVYEDLNSFPEIFHSISLLLRAILDKNKLPDILRANLQNCKDFIERKITEHNNTRLPLQMHKKKPEPIRLMNPKFEENFVKGVDYDPDRERVKHKRLLKKIKSEEKGSIRELRKDKDFLVIVRERKRREEEAERAEKYGKNLAILQDQERAFKSGQLGKGRKRRK